MSLPKYQEYKDSGVEWLGDVPAHWPVDAIKREFEIVGGSTPKSDVSAYWDGDITWASPADLSRLPTLFISDSARKITSEGLNSCGTTVVPAGSIVLSTRAPIGSLAIATKEICTNQGCKSLVPRRGAISVYFAYVLLSATTPLNLRGKGTTFLELSADELAAFKVPRPPVVEQTAIAAFLDRETAKIDALIAEQEKLIALLAEKRQATISHAVTRGLNPDAPMKVSGVAWLGEVPEHWGVRRLKTISPEITVGIVVEPSKYYVDDGVPALRSLNVNAGAISKENLVYISEQSNELLAKSRLRAGDLVSVRSGQTGVTAIVPSELDGCNCIDLIIIRKPSEDCERYLCWFFASDAALQQFSAGSGGAIQQHFNIGMAMNLQVLRPPLSEQRAIDEFIRKEVAKLDSLQIEAERAIGLLKERRSALISAAVTGRFDVRMEVPQPVSVAV